MTQTLEDSPLYPLVNCRSMAYFGASNNLTAMGSLILSAQLATGFAGPIYPVHPTEDAVQGLKAYRSVADLPEVPDLALFVLPPRLVAETLAACGEKGIRRAVIVSGGFQEVGPEGAERQREIVAVAARYGIRFIGPNCIGVVNTHHRLNTTLFLYDEKPGFIGLASQSGSFVAQMFNHLTRHAINFSTAFSVGNEANVDIVDCMEYLAADPRTKVIGLYIEGIRRGEAFVKAARAISPRKPIVAYYVGGSETGSRAGFSHTGAMAGPDAVYDGIFRQCGIIRARSVTELFDFCWVLGALPLPAGRRMVIQTHSGGPGAAAADHCGREGLDLPLLSPETVERLKPFLPHTASFGNPVDMTFARNQGDYFAAIPDVLLREPGADMLLLYILVPSLMIERSLEMIGLLPGDIARDTDTLIETQTAALAALVGTHGKPVIGYTYRGIEEKFCRRLMEKGLPVFAGPERAARALTALVQYRKIRNRQDGSAMDEVGTGTT